MKNNFLSGAMILMAANAVSKLLGAVLKIPLTYIIQEEGMAVYNTAFSVYVMFLTFVVSGMPFAVQKLTSAFCAVDDRARAFRLVRLSTFILSVAGALGSAVMWIGADFFALAMKEARAAQAIRAVAPSIFLVALGTAAKSGSQGESDMLPTAVSQVAEAFVKLAAGYVLAVVFIGYGTEYAAAGATGGVTVGELTATAILVVWYELKHRGERRITNGTRNMIRELADIALPLLFMSAVGSALSVCDTSVLRMSLIRSGLSEEEARFLYGSYTGYAMTLLNLPIGFLATLGISVIPVISGAVAVGNVRRVQSMSFHALLITGGCGIMAVGVLAVFGEGLLQLLFRNVNSAAMLRMAAPSVLFICVMQISGAILQSLGAIGRTFISSVSAAVVKLCFSIFAVSVPQLNIYGAALGADVSFFVGMVMNLLFLNSVISKTKNDYKMNKKE